MEKDKGRGSVQVRGCGVLVIHFFGVYAPLVKRFSLPIRRVRGREARFVDSLFFATPKMAAYATHSLVGVGARTSPLLLLHALC